MLQIIVNPEFNEFCSEFNECSLFTESGGGQHSPGWLNSCGKICIDLSRQMLKTHFRLCMCVLKVLSVCEWDGRRHLYG